MNARQASPEPPGTTRDGSVRFQVSAVALCFFGIVVTGGIPALGQAPAPMPQPGPGPTAPKPTDPQPVPSPTPEPPLMPGSPDGPGSPPPSQGEGR